MNKLLYMRKKGWLTALLLCSTFLFVQAQINIEFDVTEPSCSDFSNGTVIANPTGGTAPYTFEWSTGETLSGLYGISEGYVSVVVTDADGNAEQAGVYVADPDAVDADVSFSGDVCDPENGSLTVEYEGGVPPYSINWSDASTSEAITNLTSSYYSVTITDANGCQGITGIDLQPELTVEIETNDVICYGWCDGNVTAIISGGTAPYDILWSTGETTITDYTLPPGDYTLTVTDANGCTAENSATLYEPDQLVATISASYDCETGVIDGSATVTAMGGTPPYSYSWNNGGGNEATINTLSPGTIYSVTVTDENGCIEVETVVVSSTPILSIDLEASDASCDGMNDGTASVTISGGTSPYNVAWSTGDDMNTITGLSAATYSVTVTDMAGCERTETIIVEADGDLEVVEATIQNASCTGADGSASITITEGSAETIVWSTGAENVTSVDGLSAGTYSVTVTDPNDCEAILEIDIDSEGEFEIAAAAVPSNCDDLANGSVTVSNVSSTATPFEYEWSTGDDTETVEDLMAGMYQVTVTDANGCAGTTEVEVISIGTSEAALDITPTDCDGDMVTFILTDMSTADPAITMWSLTVNGVQIDANAGTPPSEFTVEVPANSMLEVNYFITNGASCEDVFEAEIEVEAGVSITPTITDAACGVENGAISLSIAGTADNIAWSTGAEDVTEISDLAEGNYSVTVTTACGDQALDFEVEGESDIVIENVQTTDTPCASAEGTASIEVQGGIADYTVIWSTGDMNVTEITGLAAETYTVTISNENPACDQELSITIETDDNLEVTETVTNGDCAGALGAISIDITGAIGTPSITWSTGDIGVTELVDLNENTYTVTVVDEAGCEEMLTIPVEIDGAISVLAEAQNIDCAGVNLTGSIDVTDITPVSLPPYSYAWSTGEMGIANTVEEIPSINNLEVNTYTLTVIDANGCEGTLTQDIVEEPGVEATVPDEAMACVTEDLMITTSTMQTGLTYAWSPANLVDDPTSPTPTILDTSVEGEFVLSVTITNEDDCTLEEMVMVTINPQLEAPNPDLITQVQCDGFTVDFTDDNPNAGDYIWDFGNGETLPGGANVSYTYDDLGMYQITITPNVECAEALVYDVEVMQANVALFEFDTECGPTATVDFIDMSTGTSPITSWDWDFGNATGSDEQNPSITLTQDETLNVTLTVTYENDCIVTYTQPVEVDVFNPVLENNLVDCNTGNEIGLNPNGNANYTYNWGGGISPADAVNPSVIVTETTTYAVTITDGDCESIQAVTVELPEALQSPMIGDVMGCEEGLTTTLNATTEGAVSYSWQDGNGMEVSNSAIFEPALTSPAITYTVIITDEFDCPLETSVTVGIDPVEFRFDDLYRICAGEIVAVDVPTDLNIEWSGNNPLEVEVGESGTYFATISNDNCSTQDSLNVEATNISLGLTATADPDTVLQGESTQLQATEDDGYRYEWTPSESLDADDVSNPVATPEETTIYTVMVTDDNECQGEVDVRIVVTLCDEEDLYFPNAFTPDGDGLNEVLYLRGLTLDEVYFAIFNRWGEKIFETSDQSQGWDGTHEGAQVCPDVYGYYLRAKCIDGQEFFRKGNVTVLR